MIIEKCCLFSPVTGVVFLDGKLLKNALISRSYLWHIDNTSSIDEVVTDRYGVFRFPMIVRSSKNARASNEHVIEQDIMISHDGKQYIAWQTYKNDYEINSELAGEDIILICNLNSKPRRHSKFAKVYGIGKLAKLPKEFSPHPELKEGYSILDPAYNTEAWLR